MLGLAGAVILFFVGVFRADTQVKERFQGRVWELPAKVYARPLQLYPGMALVPDLFEKELGLLGYRREISAGDLKDPGGIAAPGRPLICSAGPLISGMKPGLPAVPALSFKTGRSRP